MNSGKSPPRDWRAQPPVPSLYAREWRGGGGKRTERFSRKFKLRVVGMGLIALIALIVIMLAPASSRVPPAQIVAFGIGVYGGRANPQGNMPLNPFGEQDTRAFHVLNDLHPAQFLPIREEDNVLNGAQFLSFLQTEASASGLANKHLIVFLTLHGIVQPSGEVDLFAIDATPDSPETSPGTMVPLKDLVARLEKGSARRVLLILDTARLAADWRLGILNNDIAAQLAGTWPPRSSTPNPGTNRDEGKVAILLAAGPGQLSWSADDQSALVQYLIEGLLGAADGWEQTQPARESGTHDRRVSLHELTAFVRHHVENWTQQRYGATQTVQLLGNVTDFDLAVVSFASSSRLTMASLKSASKLKPAAIKSTAINAAKAADKEQKTDAAEGESTTIAADPAAPEKASPKKDDAASQTANAKGSAGVNWETRLEELWRIRDGWQETSRQGRRPVYWQMPLTWRAFESQLALAAALQRGGMDELSPLAIQQAEIAFKKLQSQSTFAAGWESNVTDAQRRSLQDLGFGSTSGFSADILAATGKSLLSLLKEMPTSGATDPAQSTLEFDASAVQTWLRQELRRDSSSANWDRLKLIVNRLEQIGKLPQTAESQLLREVLSAEEAAARFGKGDTLQRVFSLRDRFHKLAVQSPESLPLIRQDVQSGMRSLNAAERWLLASNVDQPEVRDWLDKADDFASQAESTTRRFADAMSIWSDLLIDLPAVAQWIATRANDDDQRKVDWARLRELARRWTELEQNGSWEHNTAHDLWPDKPARWTDLERLLLAQFFDSQRLKVALVRSNHPEANPGADELSKLVNQATRNRSDFWDELRRTLPRLGTADHPSPSLWREADRLLAQQWLPFSERRKLVDLRRLEPRGEPLPDRSSESGSLWQGFWAIATLSLFSPNQEGTKDLWKEWDRLAEISQPTSVSVRTTPLTGVEQESLRKRRAELGRAIRQQWSTIQNQARSTKTPQDLPTWHLVAATLDPMILPEANPDIQIRDEGRRQFAEWLTLFAADWRRHHSVGSSADTIGYAALAERAEHLAGDLTGSTIQNSEPSRQFRFQDEKPPSFDAKRRARLNLAIAPPGAEPKAPFNVLLSGSRIRLIEGTNQASLQRSVTRPLPSSGLFSAELQLDDDVEIAQPLLVTLVEADGYPVAFRRMMLQPPFDPTQWRIELVEAATNTPLEHVPLSSVVGTKVFLPPQAAMSVRANLVRPVKDPTPSAQISIYALTDSGRVPLLEAISLKLETGKDRTAILCDLPIPTKDKEAVPPKDSAPIADLARGLVFEITPEDQKTIDYQIRPTFWSASKFISEPQPIVRDDRLTLDLERRAATSEDVLLPKKIPVDLDLPDSLRNSLTDYTLGGPVAVGQRLTLSFGLPRNWSEQARDQNWNLALNVAGLPHAYRWRIDPSGTVTPVTGQPPQLNIRLMLPPPDPKSPPRLEPVIRKGKETLNLQFQVDATELDRTEETGDWTLAYTVVRETETGSEPTPLQHSWRMFSSVRRHILLDAIQGGVWKLRTSAENYEQEEAESEIRGLSGRFQVQATLTRSAQPAVPLATAKLRFAIDDDAPPAIDVKGLTSEPRSTDRDFAFRVDAVDLESGIQRLAFGFDKNGDKQLQDDEELIEEQLSIGLETPRATWPVVVARSKLPKLEKEEETRQLLVLARNGLGTVSTRAFPITFRKPTLPKKSTTGTLVVKLNVSRGAQSTVQITGPEARLEETKSDSLTFTELPAGQYQITVKVNYAVIGRKDAGEAKVDIRVGETTTAKVPLTTAK